MAEVVPAGAVRCDDFVPIASPRPFRGSFRSTLAGVARVPRNHLPDGIYHVTARGTGGGVIVEDDLDRIFLVKLLITTGGALNWTWHAYCVLTTHYHLLVETTRASLSKGMQRINGRYAQRFNERHDRFGHLFQNRFGAYVVETDDYFEAAAEYVLNNAFNAGLCDNAESWPWGGRRPTLPH
jgi:REP element-mobilizing transposase RayT